MAIQFENNVATELAIAIDAVTNSIEVDDASRFPSPTVANPFFITITDRAQSVVEICECTALVGNTLTVFRGRDGTNGLAFEAGAFVQMRVTAGILEEFVQRPEMDAKSDVGHTHVEADITDLDKYTQAEVDAALAIKSDTTHNHDLTYSPLVHTHVEADITDLDKYTQAEVDAALALKSDTTHNHDLTYAPLSHTHVEADITDLDKYTQAQVDAALALKLDATATAVNSDKLDNINSTQFLRSDTSDTYAGGVLRAQNDNGIDVTNTGSINGLQVFQNTAGADALMSFHVGGDYACHFGLSGDDNKLVVGGWSMGANKYAIYHEGNPPPSSGGAAPTVSIFIASGTWTKPAGLKGVKVTVVGGGGGGGGCSGNGTPQAAGGGGGGGCAIKWIAAASLGSSETVTRGGGGAGGSNSTGSNGATGGTSSFGAHCSATGGAGGLGVTGSTVAAVIYARQGGNAGVGSSGNVNLRGGGGHAGIAYQTGASGPSGGFGGNGGSSHLGGGGRGLADYDTGSGGSVAVGQAGHAYGGGGGGGMSADTATGAAGGAGAVGIIIVEEFY